MWCNVNEPVKILVSVEPSQASGVANALRRAGATVEEVLEDIGTISATCGEAAVAGLSSVPGVLSVERQREVKLPPPGSPIQ